MNQIATCALPATGGTSTSPGARFWLIAYLLVTFFLVSHDWSKSLQLRDNFALSEAEMVEGAASGTLHRRGALLALGALSGLTLLAAGRHRLSVRGSAGMMLLMLAMWAVVSSLWADEPALAMRRCLASGCLLIAAVALARQLALKDLIDLALVCTTVFLALGILAELAMGTFAPWSREARFSGTLHPNHQGMNCALLAMAAFFCARLPGRSRGWMWGLAGVGLLMVILTGSRASFAALVIAVPMTILLTSRRGVGAIVVLSLVCVLAVTAMLFGEAALGAAQDTANLGRGDSQLATLSGRIPLWQELQPYVIERPWLGHGFNAFWTSERIEDMSYALGWSIAEAHSAYLDMTLNLGLIGIGLFVMLLVLGIGRGVALDRECPGKGYEFVACVLLFFMFHGLLESALTMPGFVQFVAGTGLVMLAFQNPRAREDS